MSVPSLEDHDEVMRHHRAAWRVERAGWAVMGLMLLAALLGLFGDGPMSRAHSGSARSLGIEYDRLVRSSAPTQYRFVVNPALATRGQLVLRFDRALVERMELESIVPEPEHQSAGADHTDFLFRIEPGAAPVHIDVRYRPATFGWQRGRISIAGAHTLVIGQFAYP